MSESYEGIRDNSDLIPQDVRRQWIEADQSERMLRQAYERIDQDQDITGEAKARLANEAYEQHRTRIEGRKKAARESLLKAAKSREQFSIPRPSGEALSSNDATKLVADQNEAARLVRTIERRQDKPGPFTFNAGEYLAQEFKRGLEVGGAEGGSIVRGCLRAGQELGGGDQWLDHVRGDKHLKALDDARRLEHFAGLISTKAPKPPKSLAKAARPGRISESGPAPVLALGAGPAISAGGSGHGARKKRRRSFS